MHHRRRNPGRIVRILAAGVVASAFLAGCKSSKHYDGIEAELRTRERELAETRAALDQARAQNRMPNCDRVPGPAPAHPASAIGTIREVALARGTGGVDDDGLPGDESLMVVIVPTDDDKSAVKVPAQATIAAWEITRQGLKQPIGSWNLNPEQLRPTWRNGLLATGYFVALPWQSFPSSERVRIAVRLTTADGHVYETDRDVTVRPAPQAVPRGTGFPEAYPSTPVTPPRGREPLLPAPPPPGVPPTLPPGVEELPPPMGMSNPSGARLLPPIVR